MYTLIILILLAPVSPYAPALVKEPYHIDGFSKSSCEAAKKDVLKLSKLAGNSIAVLCVKK